MNKRKISNKYDFFYIVLLGEAGAGKDYLLEKILQFYPQFHRVISATTRPPRDNEKNNVNYHFLSEEEGREWVDRGEFIEHRTFRGWLYGTPLKNIKEGVNIGISSPSGIVAMQKYIEDRKIDDIFKIYPIYVTAPEELRAKRYKDRSKKIDDDWSRRLAADTEDFKDIYTTLSDYFEHYMMYKNIYEIQTWHNLKWVKSMFLDCQYPVMAPL